MSTALLKEPKQEPSLAKKRRMLVLICEGGGGHKMAGESLRSVFSSDYEVEVVNVLSDIIHPVDFLRTITSGLFSGEDVYNFLLRKGYHKGVNLWATVGNKYLHINQARIEKYFEKYLSKEEVPFDFVISTMPWINSGIAKALQKREVPFIIIPTDLDASTFFAGMKSSQFKPDAKVAFTLPYDDSDLRKKGIKKETLPEDKVVITGFPVREECQKNYTPDQILLLKLKHGMCKDRLALSLVLGTLGGKRLLRYTKQLATLDSKEFDNPLEINICVGKSEKVRQSILHWFLGQGGIVRKEAGEYTTVESVNGTLFHLRKFTKDLIEILVCSHLVITKTGSCSVNEAIYLGKKLLLDNTIESSARHLFWETFNLHFVRKHGLGDVFYDEVEMISLIRTLLKEDLGHPVVSGAFPLPDFRENIRKLVADLIDS